MLHNMVDLKFGIWMTHGEGKFKPSYKNSINNTFNDNLITMQYIDHNHNVTEEYPYNPNGSLNGMSCSLFSRWKTFDYDASS